MKFWDRAGAVRPAAKVLFCAGLSKKVPLGFSLLLELQNKFL
jgi:hypothetical protein